MANIQSIITNGNGNVLIGTTTDSGFKLDINGTVRSVGNGQINNAIIGEVPTYTSANAGFSHASRALAGEYSFLSANDGETFINAKAGYNIRFRVNNADQVIINASGNVGIGTTTPNSYLSGTNGLSIYASANPAVGFANPNSYWLWYMGGSQLRMWNSSVNEVLVAHTTGNVTIGTSTTDAGYKLDVIGGDLRISSASNTRLLLLNTSGSGLNYSIYSADTGNLIFGRTGIADYMTIANGGNVGIGTTSPSTLLHLDKSSSSNDITGTPSIIISNRNSTSGTFVSGGIFNNPYRDVSTSSVTAGVWFENQNSPDAGAAAKSSALVFGANSYTANWALPTERMRITQGGNVGINTNNPNARLWVEGDASTNGTAVFKNTTKGAAESHVHYGTNGDWYIRSASTSGVVHLQDLGGTTLVGTSTNNGYRLQVNGGIYANGDGYFENRVQTNNSFSDANNVRVLKPLGGSRNSFSPSETGAIKITYPVGYTNTMHRVKLNIYNYAANQAYTVYFGGYNYGPGPSWVNVFAYTIGPSGTNFNPTVRFGYDGTKMVVYIGELNSSWSYPQFFIEEVETGFNLASQFATDAWSIGLEASAFQNVTDTLNNTQSTNWARTSNSTYYNFGNVGIGTFSPASLLQVVGASSESQGVLNISNTHAGGGVFYPAAKIRNTRGDHSFGIISEFSIGSVGGTDRPSILFYSDAAAASWNVGQVTGAWGLADSFGIGYRANNVPSTFNSWPTNYFTITTGGNVLIGTTTDAGFKLDVNGTGIFRGELRVSSGARTGGIRVGGGNGAGESRVFIEANDGNSYIDSFGDSVYKPLSIEASILRLNVSSGGNVGIGNTTPRARLVVGTQSSGTSGSGVAQDNSIIGIFGAANGAGRVTALTLTNTATSEVGNDATLSFIVAGNYSATGLISAVLQNTSSAATDMVFSLYNDSMGEKMRLKANGNLLIGTTTDSGLKLDVNGSTRVTSSSNLPFFVKSSSTFGAAISFEDANTGGNDAVAAGAIGQDFYIAAGFSERLRINSNGFVGIAESPSSSWTVSIGELPGGDGSLKTTSSILINFGALGVGVAPSATIGRIDASNDIVAYSSSDLRLKENINPIENALNKVKALTGVEFDWKAEHKEAHGYEGHDTGVIAQEVQEVMPTAVRTNDTGYLAVRYEKLIGLLIEANKELANRVEYLESKLK
jgi:hypothetical protein